MRQRDLVGAMENRDMGNERLDPLAGGKAEDRCKWRGNLTKVVA